MPVMRRPTVPKIPLPSLAETTAMLAKMRKLAAPAPSRAGPRRMEEVADFGDNPGHLTMFTYAPQGLADAAPLVVVLHGCSQEGDAYTAASGWLTLADRLGFAVVAPDQTMSNNGGRCFNWFEPSSTTRGRGEVASIRQMIAHASEAYGSDPARVFVTGLSAGGAMTSALLSAYPEVFAGGAIVAGLPAGVAHNMTEAFGAMQGGHVHSAAVLGRLLRKAWKAGVRIPRISIWQGTADSTVSPKNAAQIAGQWASAHGLPETAGEMETLPGRTRSVWRGPDGAAVIELNMLEGVGHGTPLSTKGPDGLGTIAPYMLETGVSSSLEIARFWGIAPATAETPVAPETGKAEQMASAATPAFNVNDVITNALRVAGILR